MHCAGQHKPYAEWHKPCRYYRLLFRNLQAPPQIPATVFCGFPPVLTTTLPALLPMAYAGDFRGRFSTTLIAAPFLLLASVVVSVGRFRPPSPSPDWDFHRFPLCGPLSGTAAEIFHRFPWGNEAAMEAAPPEAAPLLGRLCFLSVIDGVAPYQNLISDETAWIKAVSLVFLRSIAWHRAAAPVVCGAD